MPRLPKGKKNPSDDDPFWDSWDEDEPIAKRNIRRTNKNKLLSRKNAAAADAAAYDPFGRDGFGDGWDYKPSAKFSSDDDPVPQETFSSAEDDWGTRRQQQETEQQIRCKAEREEWLSGYREKRGAAAKAAAEAAAIEVAAAREAAAAAAAKTAAEEKWRQTVNQATNCIALADPQRALDILFSLSLDESSVYVDIKEKEHVSQLYAALSAHFELQKFLASTLEDCSYFDRSSREIDESSEMNESNRTIGGDTVMANVSSKIEDEDSSEFETRKATVVVDRLPTHDTRSKTKENDSDESTFGGDTFKIDRSIDTEAGSKAAVDQLQSFESIENIESSSNEKRFRRHRRRQS